jgi:tetratricopeptide (TPR) repeat protein
MKGWLGVRRVRRTMAIAALLTLLLAAGVQVGIEARADEESTPSPLLYLPSGKYLRFVALGFDELLADIIYLWSIQYYGSYHIQDRYEYLERIYAGVISELDPRYLDPYLLGSLIMTAEAREPEMALALLDKGIERNPDVWLLSFEAGFIAYNDMKDYGRAAEYFEAALRAPDVHPLVRRLYAEMHNRAGDKPTSLQLWSEILESTEDEYVRRVAWNHVHDLKVEIDLEILRGAVSSFRERVGRWPSALGELGPRDGLRGLPRDPKGGDYLYEPVRGRVAYADRLVLKR